VTFVEAKSLHCHILRQHYQTTELKCKLQVSSHICERLSADRFVLLWYDSGRFDGFTTTKSWVDHAMRLCPICRHMHFIYRESLATMSELSRSLPATH